MTTNIFEVAARKKLRFESTKGLLTAEDLYDLPLTSTIGKANLDDIAKALYKKLKEDVEVSFVSTVKKDVDDVQIKFDIVKTIIDMKLAERQAKADAAARAEKKQEILAAIKMKEGEALQTASIEDLRKQLEAL